MGDKNIHDTVNLIHKIHIIVYLWIEHQITLMSATNQGELYKDFRLKVGEWLVIISCASTIIIDIREKLTAALDKAN
jgi:hypothetical protein